MKIQEVVQVLTNFKANPQERSRSSYIEELTDLIVTYYEYNRELAEYFTALFPPAELINFLEASQTPRPMVIRTNTIKAKRRELAQMLIQKGVNLDPAGEWNKVGLKITDSQVPIGATTEYLAGMYMLQSASSFLPVMALAPKAGERVLDMCAAPGGKTTHIAQLMKNTGVIVANESNPDRCASIKGNIHRMGFTNIVITNYDGRKLEKHLNSFDRVLVDAPCSGLGVIWKDPSVKANRTLKDIKRNAHVQKELLLSAIDVVNAKSNTGGYIVYSTCSVSVEENEEVINYVLKNRRVKLVETGLSIGEPGLHKFKGKIFHPSLVNCKRIYPHVYNMEGFFIAKLKKLENFIPDEASRPHSGVKREKMRRREKRENAKEREAVKKVEEKVKDAEEDVMIKDIKEVAKAKQTKEKREDKKERKVEVDESNEKKKKTAKGVEKKEKGKKIEDQEKVGTKEKVEKKTRKRENTEEKVEKKVKAEVKTVKETDLPKKRKNTPSPGPTKKSKTS